MPTDSRAATPSKGLTSTSPNTMAAPTNSPMHSICPDGISISVSLPAARPYTRSLGFKTDGFQMLPRHKAVGRAGGNKEKSFSCPVPPSSGPAQLRVLPSISPHCLGMARGSSRDAVLFARTGTRQDPPRPAHRPHQQHHGRRRRPSSQRQRRSGAVPNLPAQFRAGR